ncbi:MAG: type II toxin-antitoxin system VapC family toxin [Natronosporangium sp.]
MIYLDSSAIVRLLIDGEAYREDLLAYLQPRAGDPVVTSVIGYVEVCRTLIRLDVDPVRQRLAAASLADYKLVAVTDEVRRAAATLPGKALRSLDALHVASAQQLGALLDVLVTYDHRMIDAARAAGLPVSSPGMTR